MWVKGVVVMETSILRESFFLCGLSEGTWNDFCMFPPYPLGKVPSPKVNMQESPRSLLPPPGQLGRLMEGGEELVGIRRRSFHAPRPGG